LIKTLGLPVSFSDRHAELLDEVTLKQGSRIVQLDVIPTSLSSVGLDAVDRVIKRSQSSLSIRMSFYRLQEASQQEKVLLLLGRYKDRLNSLRLRGPRLTTWLLPIASAFPVRDGFPMLEKLFVEHDFTVSCVYWDAGQCYCCVQELESHQVLLFNHR
jgi:hypothetical protein